VRLHRRAQETLAEELLPGEEPLVVIHGDAGSAIIGTDRRALVFKAGVKSGLPFSHRLKPFEYESVLRVDLRREASTDVVVIHAPLKMSVCASYWVDDRDNAWHARNAIPVLLPDPQVEAGSALLSELVAEFHAGHEQHVEPVAAPVKPVALAGPSLEDCPRCGATIRSGWQFCARCGAPAETLRPVDPRHRHRFSLRSSGRARVPDERSADER
jgi:hypothetical protein